MKRLVWFVLTAFLAGVLVAGCGKPEEPKAKKPAATTPAPEKKEAEKKAPEKTEPEKKEPEKKPENRSETIITVIFSCTLLFIYFPVTIQEKEENCEHEQPVRSAKSYRYRLMKGNYRKTQS